MIATVEKEKSPVAVSNRTLANVGSPENRPWLCGCCTFGNCSHSFEKLAEGRCGRELWLDSWFRLYWYVEYKQGVWLLMNWTDSRKMTQAFLGRERRAARRKEMQRAGLSNWRRRVPSYFRVRASQYDHNSWLVWVWTYSSNQKEDNHISWLLAFSPWKIMSSFLTLSKTYFLF